MEAVAADALVSFTGKILEAGEFKNHTVKIDCTYDSLGDPDEQRNVTCTVQMFGPAQRGAYMVVKSKHGSIKMVHQHQTLIMTVPAASNGRAHAYEAEIHLKAASRLVPSPGATATGLTTDDTWGASVHIGAGFHLLGGRSGSAGVAGVPDLHHYWPQRSTRLTRTA